MPSTSVVATVVPALQAQLREREGLADAAVFRFAQKPEAYGTKHIVLMATAEGSFEFRGMPLSKRSETVTITGALEARAPGAGDDAAQAAHDDAQAMLAELEAQLLADPRVGGTCMTATLQAARHRPTGDEANRYHVIEFDIEIMALIG